MTLEAIFFVIIIVSFYRALGRLSLLRGSSVVAARATSGATQQILDYADRLFKERKFLASEKAYLRVLKVDHRSVAAYERLAAIYVLQKKYQDAAECLEIAAQLAPTALHYQQLASVYADNRNYIKSIAAYEKAIMFEATPARYFALHKVFKAIANNQKAIIALEHAVALEESPKYLRALSEAYLAAKDRPKAEAIERRLARLRANANSQVRPGQIIQPQLENHTP